MTYYVFGQDIRLAGARTALNSLPNAWYNLDGPIPVTLDDPLGRGDSEPSGGADKIGDIISGAFSLYSERLCQALRDFGVEFTAVQTLITVPGREASLLGYSMVLGIADAQCLAQGYDEAEFFEIDADKTNGLHMFDLEHTNRIIDQAFKTHLDTLNLEGVFMVPTKEFGGTLEMRLKMG